MAKVFGFAMADYELGWSWSFKHFKVAGAYRLSASKDLLVKLVTGIMGAIKRVVKKAISMASNTNEFVKKYKHAVASGMQNMRKKCQGRWFKKGSSAAKRCEWKFGIAIKGAKAAIKVIVCS